MDERLQKIRQTIIIAAQNWRVPVIALRNRLLAGIAVSIPLIVTVWVLKLGYNFINDISEPYLKVFGINYPGVPFLVTLALLLIAGTMATHVIGRRVLGFAERMLMRVPVVATIYAGVKHIADSLKGFNNTANFKRVVYVEYPAEGCKLIGFVTGQFFDSNLQREMTTVVIPTAPNPMTGLVLVVDSLKVINSELSLDEAMKLIVSAGLVGPKKKPPVLVVEEVR
jgi:uncharacterized membrane protein